MRVVLYARVSSEKQAEKDLSISAQLKALRNYAEDRGWKVHKEYIDEAESARTANRPAFQQMIAHAKQRQFDAILVWKMSRFARNREDSIIYKSLLRKYGVKVVSINEQLDESPAGKLLEGMIEVIDEFYSTNLAQDTLRGMKENASRGFRNGGIVPMGYRQKSILDGSTKRTVLELDPDFAPIIKRIFDMSASGLGAKEIVKSLNEEGLRTSKGRRWGKHNIYYILNNETYTGNTFWNRVSKEPGDKGKEVIQVPNTHPAIVDEVTFQKVQRFLKSRTMAEIPPRALISDYLLSSLLICGKCGLRMLGTPAKSSRYFYYACQNHLRRGRTQCDAKMIRREKLEDFIIERLKRHVLTEKNILELVNMVNEEAVRERESHQEQLQSIDQQVADIKKRLDKLYQALECGVLDMRTLAPRIKEHNDQIEALEIRRSELLDEVQTGHGHGVTAVEIRHYAEDIKLLLGLGTLMERKSFIRSFVKRIEIKDKQVTIEYTLPLAPNKKELLTEEVLSIVGNGGPSVT
jgi:site-specific DNA recombinase